jgi:hypothetical protein
MGYLVDIVGAILLIALLAFIASSVPSRRGLILTLSIVIGLITAIAWYVGLNYQRQQRRAEHSTSLIAPGQLTVKDLQVAGDELFKVTGTIANRHSDATVRRITLKVAIRDCGHRIAGACESVGTISVPISVTIPPGESRAFTAYARLPSQARVRVLAWTYEIGEIVGVEEQ